MKSPVTFSFLAQLHHAGPLRRIFLQMAFLLFSSAPLISAKEPGFSDNLSIAGAALSDAKSLIDGALFHSKPLGPTASASVASGSGASDSVAASEQTSSKSDEKQERNLIAADPMNVIFYLETKDGDLPVTPQTPFSTFTQAKGYYSPQSDTPNSMRAARQFNLIPEHLFATGLLADLEKNPKISLSDIHMPKMWSILRPYDDYLWDFPVVLRNTATKGPMVVQFPLFLAGETFLSGNEITLVGETAMNGLVVGVDPSQDQVLASGTRFFYLDCSVPTRLNIRGKLWVGGGGCLVKSDVHIDGALLIGIKPGKKGMTIRSLMMYHSAITADTLDGQKQYENFGPNSTLDDVRDLFEPTQCHRSGISFYGNCSLSFKSKAIAKGEYDLWGDGDAFISDVPHSMNNSIATVKNVHFAPMHLECNFPTVPGKGYYNIQGTVDLTNTEICVHCLSLDIQDFTFDKRILLIQSTTPIQGQPIRVYVRNDTDFQDKDGLHMDIQARLEIEGNKAYIVLSKKPGRKRFR